MLPRWRPAITTTCDITSIDSRGIIAARTTPDNFIKIAGSPPMHYPTHTMSQAIGVTGAHMTRVSATAGSTVIPTASTTPR